MKSKLINFEYFPAVEKDTYNRIIHNISIASKQGYKSVIGLLLADGFLYKHNDSWNNLHNEIIKYAKHIGIDVTIVSGMSHNNAVNCEVIKFNFYLHIVWNTYKNKIMNSYNPTTKKFLFLGGVPDRPNRIGLLYNLYRKDLLKYAKWSFFPPWTVQQEKNSMKFFPSEKDYHNFIKIAERKVDDLYDCSKTYGTGEIPIATDWTNNIAWIDPDLYFSTSLSLISEGHPGDENNNSQFLTEKIYRVFVQGHPFLLAANPTIFNYIKELGFKTFEEYFPDKDYAVDTPEEERLNKLINNLKYFVNEDINFTKDVEYNRQHFFKLAEENAKILDMLNASETEIAYYFNRTGFGHLL